MARDFHSVLASNDIYGVEYEGHEGMLTLRGPGGGNEAIKE